MMPNRMPTEHVAITSPHRAIAAPTADPWQVARTIHKLQPSTVDLRDGGARWCVNVTADRVEVWHAPAPGRWHHHLTVPYSADWPDHH